MLLYKTGLFQATQIQRRSVSCDVAARLARRHDRLRVHARAQPDRGPGLEGPDRPERRRRSVRDVGASLRSVARPGVVVVVFVVRRRRDEQSGAAAGPGAHRVLGSAPQEIIQMLRRRGLGMH